MRVSKECMYMHIAIRGSCEDACERLSVSERDGERERERKKWKDTGNRKRGLQYLSMLPKS